MLNLSRGIQSLTTFKRQSAEMIDELHATGEPLILTVNGRAEVVVQDAAAYQRLVEAAQRREQEETIAALEQGLADAKAGRVKPAREAIKALAKKHGIAVRKR